MTDSLILTRRYFSALAAGVSGDDLATFYHPDVVQEELPNRFTPDGARRDLAGILAAAERGKTVMSQQQYDIEQIVAEGNRVAVEFRWTGTLAIPIGTLAAGDQMRGRFASFLEFREGRIISQRSYDCFEAW